MLNIQYRDEIYHSPEDVSFLTRVNGFLKIQNDGSVYISRILQDAEVHFKPNELGNNGEVHFKPNELGNNGEVKFDKSEKYQINPYDIELVPRKRNPVPVESKDYKTENHYPNADRKK